ncbi:MAG: alcohol dehydrogenase catalytic domain-containing protein, partial [Actinomycetota bacterium]
MDNPKSSRAFTVGKTESGWARRVVDMPIDQLGDGDVLVRVEYSGINFKDGLASTESGRIARIDPLIGGVDLAGTVVESSNSNFKVGAGVIGHGYDIGVSHHG